MWLSSVSMSHQNLEKRFPLHVSPKDRLSFGRWYREHQRGSETLAPGMPGTWDDSEEMVPMMKPGDPMEKTQWGKETHRKYKIHNKNVGNLTFQKENVVSISSP